MSTWDEAILNALPGRMQPVTRSVNVSRHSNAAFTKGCPLRRRIAWEQPIVGRYVDVDERHGTGDPVVLRDGGHSALLPLLCPRKSGGHLPPRTPVR